MARGLLALLCILPLVLGGCWSRRELTEVSYADLMALDWIDDQYLVTVNIISPRTGGGSAGAFTAEVLTISGKARAMDEALVQIDQVLPRSLTLAHVRSVIIGEALAQRGIWPVLDFFLRSVEVRPNAWVGVTKGLARDLLQVRPPVEGFLLNSPLGFHELGLRRTSQIPNRRLVEVAYVLLEQGIDLSLPVFRLGNQAAPAPDGAKEPDPEQRQEVVFGGAGVFQGDRLVGWLSPNAARGELWVRNRVVHGAITAPCPDSKGMAVFRLRDAESRLQVYSTSQGPRARIRVEAAADLNELHCPEVTIPTAGPGPLDDLLSQAIRSEIEAALEVARRTGSDFLGLGLELYRRSPAWFLGQRENWVAQLAQMPVEIQVQARVPRLGHINQRYRWRQPQ